MNENKGTLRRASYSHSGFQVHSPSFMALALCLGHASSLLGGCAVGAVVGVMTAATEVGVLAETALEAVLNTDEPESVVVKKETDIYSGPGEEYARVATLHEGDEILVLGYQGYWIECQCDECEEGWIRCPCAPDR
jgi:uncharacterized protein YgiM (DUF1202 family)